MNPIFVFDIETVPDVEGARRLGQLHDLSDDDVAQVMFHQRRQETGSSEFLRHHLHKIVAISVVLRLNDKLKIWSLGTLDSDEAELVKRFFDGLQHYTPTLVSWNGSGFDLPVLHYRSLVHGIAAPRYWDMGDENRDFKWNNYLSRFHWRHMDMMDILAGFQPRANAPLDDIACLLGLPGKMGMSGAKVWKSYLAGELQSIREYCETDVLNTYLVFLRFQLIRGQLDQTQYQAECQRLKDNLVKENKPHFGEFLTGWDESV